MHIWMHSLTKNVPLPQEEKRKMKEEIERRRAEAAEKRQKVEDTMDGEEKPFKCVSPRGSSLKVGLPFLTFHLHQHWISPVLFLPLTACLLITLLSWCVYACALSHAAMAHNVVHNDNGDRFPTGNCGLHTVDYATWRDNCRWHILYAVAIFSN